MYNKRTWLNPETSPSLGSVVAFDDMELYKGELYGEMFLAISDCKNFVKLHKGDKDKVKDFVNKMTLLRDEISLFIEHLKTVKDE